jgi:hypothetical protein
MSLSRWGKGGDSDQVTGLNWDTRLVGYRKIPAVQWAKLPRYGREGAVEVRPFPAKTRLRASEAQGLSGEAVKGNPPTTVIPGVDESKPSHRATDDSTEPEEPGISLASDDSPCPVGYSGEASYWTDKFR